ncbi:MAG: replication-relaxation family protein [Actinomycetia bacterium]|nr:replication-relaxation family protein [Actinomycetes bacterium]
MSSISLTDKNIELLEYLATLKMMTENQICALFYGKHDSFNLDMYKARNAMSGRISSFVKADIINKIPIPTQNNSRVSRQGYVLGPAGADILKEEREIERRQLPHWLQRRDTDVSIHATHNVLVNNVLINLIMLSRLKGDFFVDTWLSDRDCRFYIELKNNDNKLLFHPDFFLMTSNGSQVGSPVFVELDRGRVSPKSLAIKIRRTFQYYESGKYKVDLTVPYFPKMAIVVPDQDRIDTFMHVIAAAKKHYPRRANVDEFPFWLTTYEGVDVYAIDEGRVSTKPLDPVWLSDQGVKWTSPFTS